MFVSLKQSTCAPSSVMVNRSMFTTDSNHASFMLVAFDLKVLPLKNALNISSTILLRDVPGSISSYQLGHLHPTRSEHSP
mmetsp:Transcript_1909/g.4325  ORF Transcript_1909/g.4325 Transcript_1909/m.4325 type:complete len:80 (-) Transcript_1909:804-1043(-)